MPDPNNLSKRFSWSLESWGVLAVVVLVGWFYLWTVDPEGDHLAFSKDGGGYYNALTRGFLKGQLSLDIPADPFLATLKDPYDPGQRAGHGLHDASYFKGRYYLYFGVTPVLVLFAPVRLLTGWFIDERFASLVFSWTGFLFSVATFRAIRRRSFGGAPAWLSAAGVVALGLATMVPAMLRRPSIWEVPISCAYALFMVTLYCLWRSVEGSRPRTWLALGSLAMGLCIGARPVYLGAAVLLLAPLAAEFNGWRQRAWWFTGVCAIGPIAGVGAGLAAYNFLRFGSPTEFGQTFQMAGDNVSQMKLFSPGFAFYSARVYLFSPAGLTPFFPFVTVISPPPPPPGQLGVENPYGLVPNMPWVVLALATIALVVRPRAVPGGRALGFFCAGAFAAGLAIMVMVFSFGGVTSRYMVDFTPVFVLLGGVGALSLITIGQKVWRMIASAGVVVLLAWSAGFGVLVSLQHNELLRVENPVVYARVAHAFNRVAQWFVPVRAAEVGPVELKLVFPRKAAGQVEPLVVTGREFHSDYVFVHYLAEDTVRFGFDHTSRGGAVGPPVKIVPGAPHTVRVTMGSLFPPRAHPYFDALSAADARARSRSLRVWLDEKVVFQRSLELYDAAERVPSIGTSGGRPGFKRDFSGTLLGWKRRPDSPPDPAAVQTGPLRLRVKWPAFTGRRTEPLLSTGATGKGDLVYLTYEDARHVSFGHDHWGLGGARSDMLEIDPDVEHVIELSCPPLLGPEAPVGLRVRLDGREVFFTPAAFHPCEPDTVSVGANEILASTAEMFFSGEVLSSERLTP